MKKSLTESGLKYFKYVVNAEHLKIWLSMVTDMIQTSLKDKMAIEKVTNVRTIADTMHQSKIYKEMLSEIEDLKNLFYNSSCICYRKKIFFKNAGKTRPFSINFFVTASYT